MAYKVVFRPNAEADILDLYNYIADQSGTKVAQDYIDEIETACLALTDLPERDHTREDIGPGVRTISLGRRVTICYRVLTKAVEIVAVVYGGRRFTPEAL